MPRDSRRLTPGQQRALAAGEVLRLDAAIDIRGGNVPSREYQVDAVASAVPSIQAALEGYGEEAGLLVRFAKRLLEYWDCDGAVHEHLAQTEPESGLFILPVPSVESPAIFLIYGRGRGKQIWILGGYPEAASPGAIDVEWDEVRRRRTEVP